MQNLIPQVSALLLENGLVHYHTKNRPVAADRTNGFYVRKGVCAGKACVTIRPIGIGDTELIALLRNHGFNAKQHPNHHLVLENVLVFPKGGE